MGREVGREGGSETDRQRQTGREVFIYFTKTLLYYLGLH